MRNSLYFFNLICSLFFLLSGSSWAAKIPPSLQEWQDWVLEKHPQIKCPVLFNNSERQCVWISELVINANTQSANFSQQIETFADTWVTLPGGAGFWPENIREADNKIESSQLIVREQAGLPEVLLPAGRYELQGTIQWDLIPRTLTIPNAAGIVKLQLNGNSISNPSIEGNNQLWLVATKTSLATPEKDSLQVRVYRQLSDEIPFKVITRLILDVSGKEREIKLGQLILPGFSPIAFASFLPARLESDGQIRIQIKPGTWQIDVTQHSIKPIINLGYQQQNELWPAQEIWTFAAQPVLRSVQISGVSSIDPQQTGLPEEWRQLPAYLVTPDTPMQLEELQRGGKDTSNQLTLTKDIWLDFSGEGFTLRDKMNGTFRQNTERQGWRLETLPPYQLQSARVDDLPQLVTQLGKKESNELEKTGIEIRNRQLNLEALNRLENTNTIPVSGWSTDVNEVKAELHLPPGWSLLKAKGASYESGSWYSQWSLWDIFLVLIISFTLARITKPLWGLLVFVTLLLTYQRVGAPLFIWLNLVALLALLPMVSGKFKTFLVRYAYLSFLVLAVIILPFSVQQAREVFYPQLEFAERNIGDSYGYGGNEYAANVSADLASAPASEALEDAMVSRSAMKSAISSAPELRKEKYAVSQEYDPGQQVQTGPGIPKWQWKTIYLHWNGPVTPDETSTLYLVSPLFNRLGSLLSVILPILLSAFLLQHLLVLAGLKEKKSFFFRKNLSTPALLIPCLIAASLSFMPSEKAQADVVISPALLKELETRLTQPAKCLPNCASIENLSLTMDGDNLNVVLNVHSADFIALPLPSQRQQWWPNQVLVNGKPASLTQNAQGNLLVNLRPGRHLIQMKALVIGSDLLNLAFVLPLHNVTSQLKGWDLTGTPGPNQPSSALQLQRTEQNKIESKTEDLRTEPLPPFVIVRRELQLGLEWRIETTIERVAPVQGIIKLNIPLLEGESPLSGSVAIKGDEASKGKIAIHLDAEQQQTSWFSVLKAESPIELTASNSTSWIEIWTLSSSAVWHTEFSGIPSIQFNDYDNLPLWQPWPGESLSINVERPQAVQGNLMSIDSASFNYTLGQRANNAHLSLSLRTNQAGQYIFTLPDNIKLESITADNQTLVLQPINGQLKIPVRPGTQQLDIRWQGNTGIDFKTQTPAFNLKTINSNQTINMTIPHDRWPLIVGGPSIGPAVLLWGMLAVILLLAVGLGRSGITPLKTYEWILLSLGVATVNLYVLALIAIWLLLLAQRGKINNIESPLTFKWMQVGLFGLSLFALFALLGSIPYSLLSAPDMHITGNGSNAHYLRWYQDQSANEFPQAWVISLPLWSYKLAMLVWSLWLASALLRWVRWGWQQLSHVALWELPKDNENQLPKTNEGQT
jgi:hypothetical protein